MQNINKTKLSLDSLFRTITLFLVLFLFNQSVALAQCDPGSPNCADSDVIDFPFQTRMLSDINGNGEIPGCGGQGFFHNTTWYRIIPTSPFIFIDITSSNCTTVGGNQGIQLGLYPACDPNQPPIGTIQCDCASPGQTITLGGVVTPGESYYIMVDGCSGSTCDLNMDLTTGSVQMPVVNLGNPSQPETIDQIPTCPGAELTFTIPPVVDADVYTWNFPPGVTIIDQVCNEITVEWGPIGGDVTVNVTNVTNGQTNGPSPPLNVPVDPPMYSLTREYCSPESPGYEFYGDGITYSDGVYQILVPGPLCDTLVTLTVNENLIAVANLIELPTTCNSSQDNYFENGQATIFMQNNGGGPFSYQWENSSVTGPTNNQLPTGTTGVTITDLSTGCEVEEFIFIDEPPYLFADVNVDVAPSCGSAADGEMIVFAQGGTSSTGNYTYAWSGPNGYTSTQQNPTDVAAGIHELLITDDNGCEFLWIGNVVAAGGTVTATESNLTGESCAGANNGGVTLTGDGPGTFTFTWPGMIDAATRNDLAAGDYEVTISNGSGCTGTQTVTIAPGSSFTVDASAITNVVCFGESNGSVTVDVTGGTGTISYDLGSGTVAGNVISDLATGNYMLTVTDGAGCTSETPVFIDTPTEFLPTIANTPVTCGGSNNGTATVTPVGGVMPYTYMWGDGETTQDLANLPGGIYDVTVMDGNMCSVELSTDVDGGGSLGVLIDPAVTDLEVSCAGESDGTVTVNVTGASGAVSYTWTGSTSTTETASGLAPGMYSVVAMDAAGCSSAPFEVTITAPTPLMVAEVSTTQTSCEGGNDGVAEVSVSGGTGTNYTFEWNNSGETTNPAVNLGPGDHIVTVRDENNCPQTLMVTIAEPAAITATLDPVAESCADDDDGTVTVNAAGGSGSYLYEIQDGNGPQANNVFTNLAPDDYTVIVTNADGSCAQTFPVTVMAQVALTATITPTDVSCAGAGDGEITATPSGGVGPYSYLWTDGETTQTITGKDGGGYFVTITDINMCQEIFPTNIAEAAPIVVTLNNQTGAACDGSGGATASVNVIGGDGNYTYTWSAGTPNANQVSDLNAGMVSVVVEDGDNCSSMPFEITILAPDPVTLLEDQVTAETCFEEEDGIVTVMTNGGNGPFEFSISGGAGPQNSNEFTNLAPGDYVVNVIDDNGCTDMVNITIAAANQIIGSVDPNSDLTVCDGDTDGSITIIASGGDGNLMYELDNSGTPQNSNVFNNVDGGNHIVTIIDGNNCTSADIDVTVTELAPIDLDVNLPTSELTICDSATDGVVTIDAVGGDGSFTYTLGATTQNSNEFTGLTGGNYTIQVEDGNGCTNDIDFTVTELAPITISLDAVNSDLIVCAGESDGTVTITASGGDNNLTYSIPGETNTSGAFSNLDPNNYTVTVMDGNMCSETFDFTVDPAPAITVQVDAAASDLALCNGDTDGSVTIDANGGDGNFMYSLGGPAQASPVFNNLSANVYTGFVTDGNGCSEPISVTVTEADAIVANITASDLLVCNGFTDGSVTITASGGDDNFTYQLDAGATQASNVFNNLAPGPHTVLITDGNNCTTTPVDFTVDEGAAIIADVAAASDLLVCDGIADGSITIMASGGTGALSYDIQDGNGPQPSNEFTGLGDGAYTILITDADGCSPMPVNVTIDAAAPVTGVIDPVSTLAICDGETIGSITVNGSGGTGVLTYTLNPGNISQTTNVFNDLPGGNYTIDIEDENGCTTAAIPVAVQEAPALTAAVDPNSDLINCFGDSDGSITIDAAGGNGPLMYSLNNGAPQASNTFDNLAPGDYTIIVTDQNGCPSAPVNETVAEAAVLDAQLTLASSDLTVCSGVSDGTAAFEATGGDGNYMYALDNGFPQAGNSFSNLAEGSYTVTIIDGNGCEQPVPFTVAPAPAITYTTDITNVGCFGEAEGQIAINVMGGDGPFDFVWSNGQVTETAQLLTAGPQTVTIIDANLCEVTETFMITEPVAALNIDDAAVVIQPATCGDTNGSVSVSVSGGTAPYSYDWGTTTDPDLTNVGPGSFTVTITDANMCEAISAPYSVSEPGALGVNPNAVPVACNGDASGSISIDVVGGTAPYFYEWTDDPTETTADRTNLPQGTYTVIVSDTDGCILPELNVDITEPAALTTTLTPTQADCGASNGSVSLLVEGGTGIGTYTYEWTGGISTDPNLIDVPAGIYDVTVTDGNMCQVISSTAEVTNPGTPTLAIAGDDVTCFGASTGSIMLDIQGGSGGNTIDWGANPELNGLTNPTNLPAGDYFVTVTDMSMCEASTMITISEPAAPIVITELTVSQATCGNDNGSVTVSVSGGTGNYTYSWSGGTGTSATVIDLPSGNVDLTVTDQNMCTEVATYNVSEPGALEVAQATVINANCNGTSTGSIDISVIGGTGPGTYTYAWADGFGTDEDLSNLPAGTYSLLITDQDDCTFNYTTTITEPELLTAIGTPIMANCGQSNGGINITVSGGTEPYDYAWNDPLLSTSEDLMNVPAANYSVTITDAQMCEFIFTDDVENPNPPMIGIVSTDAACNGTATGTADISVMGGSGNYTYDWGVAGIVGANPTNLPMGTYTVTVSDDLNCSAVETITIGEPELLVLTVEEVVQATCGEANGSVSIGITGGTLPYTYDWGGGLTTEDIQNLVPGNYTLNFMDGNGCTLTESFVVSEPNALNVIEGPISQVDCPGGNNGSIQVIAEGGSGPGTYTYMWSNGDTDDMTDNLIAGTYILTVTDTDGCEFEYSTTITQPDEIMITGTTTDAVCGEANGSITLTVTGGTGIYTYLWDNGAAPVQNPGSLPAGLYNVTVTDQNNCQELFDISVTSPNAPEVGVTSAPISCNGADDGSIDLTVTNGTGVVTITWTGNPQYDGQTSVNDLPPGTYEIIAEDEVGCTFPVNITIDEPQLLEAFAIDPQSSTLCNGSADGSIELTVQGGTGGYTYQWTNGAGFDQNPDNLAAGLYDVIVTDENGCTATETVVIVEPDPITLTADPFSASCSNTADGGINVTTIGGNGGYTYAWSNGDTAEDLTDLLPGSYTLVVSDQNSCNGTIDVVVPAPAPVTISLTDVSDYNGFNTTCNEAEDGFITVSAEGGNAGYTYAWADGTDGPTIGDIGQGTYSVIVTDQEGCTGQNNFSLDAPAPITVDVETDEPECFGESNGVVIINGVEGGRLPYRYSLNNGDYTTAQFFGNLASGTYSLAVEDANGCTSDLDVVVDEVEEIVVSLDSFPVREIVLGDAITISPQTNIVLDSNFVWSVSTIAEDTLGQALRPVVSPYNTTSYTFTVTDEFGCSASDELLVQVTKPRLIYIPNAFNPNSTNGNNVFMVRGGQDVSIVRSMKIFNRWGEVVYSDRNFPPDNPLRGAWDGFFRTKEAQSGVYVYVIEVDFIDGESKMYSGDVTLLR